MRFRWGAYVLVVALAACGSSSAAASSTTQPPPASSCGPADGHTLAASGLARVYSVRGEVYGCAFATHRSYWLGAAGRTIHQNRVEPVAVAGEKAAYGLSSFGIDTVSSEVVVRNLADGRRLHRTPASTIVQPESFQSVASIVARADGAVAWISRSSSIVSHGSQAFQVWRIDTRGQSLLDSGGSIAGNSLCRSGTQLTWRNGSRTQTATLR